MLSRAAPADPRSPAGVDACPFVVHPVFWPCGGVVGTEPLRCVGSAEKCPPQATGSGHASLSGVHSRIQPGPVFLGFWQGLWLGPAWGTPSCAEPGLAGAPALAVAGTERGVERRLAEGVVCVPGGPGRWSNLGGLPGGAGRSTLNKGKPASQESAWEALSAGLGTGQILPFLPGMTLPDRLRASVPWESLSLSLLISTLIPRDS